MRRLKVLLSARFSDRCFSNIVRVQARAQDTYRTRVGTALVLYVPLKRKLVHLLVVQMKEEARAHSVS